MRKNRPIGIILLGIIILIELIQFNQTVEWRQATDTALDSIRYDLIERDHLDSLYHEHLKDCSFIDKNNIQIGNKGILYSVYHKDTQW